MSLDQNAPVWVQAERIIEVPVEVVWGVLSDIRDWPAWNTSVSSVSMYGEFAPQTEFNWKADGVTVVSTLQEIEAPRRLLWTGRMPGIRATHLWLLDEVEGKTRVRTEETFEGLMARLLKGPLHKMLRTSLEKGLQCLKAESERRGLHTAE